MNNLCVGVILGVAGLYGQSASAQQTFNLNEPLPESSVYCFTQSSASDIADAGAANNEAFDVVFKAHYMSQDCVVMKAVVTYRRLVYRNGEMRVYEGTIGSAVVYNITKWIAVGEHGL